jgi:hypothetical protein
MQIEDSQSEMEFAQALVNQEGAKKGQKAPVAAKVVKPVVPAPKNKEALFAEMLKQQMYTDIVDLVMKYLKSIKGSPADLVELLGFIKLQLCDHYKKPLELPVPVSEKENTSLNHDPLEKLETQSMMSKASSYKSEGSKIELIMAKLQAEKASETQMLIEFHLKLLYSTHKNRRAPAYMLKSILISLDQMTFDR